VMLEPHCFLVLSAWCMKQGEGGKKGSSCVQNIRHHSTTFNGPGSSVSIVMATDWKVQGLKTGGGEIFRTSPDQPWGQPSLLYSGYWVFPKGKEQPGCDADPSPPSRAVGHKRVELYLYSPYGAYGLYRESVPVQGCTLPLTLLHLAAWVTRVQGSVHP
jgi:hypothetical protein